MPGSWGLVLWSFLSVSRSILQLVYGNKRSSPHSYSRSWRHPLPGNSWPGPYTYAGLYETYFCSLPDEPEELGNLISHQIVHRVTLREGNTNANADLRYGDMTRYPWYRARCEDDIFCA